MTCDLAISTQTVMNIFKTNNSSLGRSNLQFGAAVMSTGVFFSVHGRWSPNRCHLDSIFINRDFFSAFTGGSYNHICRSVTSRMDDAKKDITEIQGMRFDF